MPDDVSEVATDMRPAAFEAFLKDFKTTPEEALTHAIGNVTIGEDDLSDDDYDFMDEDEEARARRQQEKAAKRGPQPKYQIMLQELADRNIDEVMIDLDDLASVRTNLLCCSRSGRGC